MLAWARGNLLLLVFGELSAQDIQRLRNLSGTAPARCVQVAAKRGQVQVTESIVDLKGHMLATCTGAAAGPTRWALLRPDTYIAAVGSQIDGKLVNAARAALGHRA